MITFENLLTPAGRTGMTPEQQKEAEEKLRRRALREDLARDKRDGIAEMRRTVDAIARSGSSLDEEIVCDLAMEAAYVILSPASVAEVTRPYQRPELLMAEDECIPAWLSWDAAHGQLTADFPELSRRLVRMRGIRLQGGTWFADGKETTEGGVRRIVKDVLDIPFPRSGRAVEEAMRALRTDAQPEKGSLCLSRGSDIEPSRQRFLFDPWFPLGKLTIVQADGGTGKTSFLCTVAALVTRGQPLGSAPCTQPGSAILFSTEDDPGELAAKLTAAGADMARIFLSNGMTADMAPVTFTDPELEPLIRSHGARLVVFDPFQSFLGARTDMNRANETRPVLARLAGIAERCGCAIVLLCHLGKSQKDAIYGALGSVDITASARSGLHLMRDPRQPEREADVLCFHFKHNNSPMGRTLRLRIDGEGCARVIGEEDETIGSLTREMRRQALAEEQAQREAGKAAEAEHSLLLPVLRQLLKENPGGLAISGADLIGCVYRMFGHCPYTQDKSATAIGREAARLAPVLLAEGWDLHSQTVRPSAFLFQGVKMEPEKPRDAHVRGFRALCVMKNRETPAGEDGAEADENAPADEGFSFVGGEKYA